MEDIKKNVQELANIAIQEDVSEEEIMMIRQKAKLTQSWTTTSRGILKY